MANQNDVRQYAQAIQAELADIATPVPVYANFNRNFATEPKFITWQLRDVHQPVYTGVVQSNKGIDTPTFQISVFTQGMADGFDIANTILQALHGYNGLFGGATYGFNISKADVVFLYNGYDNDIGLHNIFMDCTIYIPS
jgi:hypothetical protein